MTMLRSGSAKKSHIISKIIIFSFVIGVVIAGISWGFLALQDPKNFPFHHIKVVIAENNHINPALIKKTVSDHVQGGFFSLQVNALRQALLEIPWIYDVSLRRIWPDVLVIDVHEQQVVARWGNDSLLNKQGEIFKPPLNSIPTNLPWLVGPPESQQEMLQCLQQLKQQLSPLGVRITSLNLSARHAWQLTLNDHMQVMLGRDALNQRIAHFVDLYSKVIGDKQDEVLRVDLRYPNGIAIQWKVQPSNKVNAAIH